ncbi:MULTISPECIES: dihydrofolate reductase family protein [unclassified Brevibacterium]|uniref:dihydrofolate reductase family protein n=1 Tax=unclassified Brevibacterium TaxID=2614124 RepID=UPI0008BCBDE2|nr:MULTISPECIES: dihydrofolate reductase family protein [unclassified Brevibacterium]OFS27262.1 hypothetical protein HMPREF3162_02445 [Brevibacterium sp. HMSC07C04]
MAASQHLHQIFPSPAQFAPDPREAALTALYDSTDIPPDRPRVQSNMVQSLDGRIAGADGLSGTISSPADKRVFAVLRALADVVIVGASTVREEGYTRLPARQRFAEDRRTRGQDPAPTLAIITGSGNLDVDHLTSAGSGSIIVFTTTDDDDVLGRLRSSLCEVIRVDSPDPHTVLEALAQRGFKRALCEGGPSLLGEWAAAGAIDEMCVTVSPLLVGGAGPGILGRVELDGPARLRLLSAVEGDSTLMLRLGFQTS